MNRLCVRGLLVPVGVLLVSMAGGCAFGDRQVHYAYTPVMKIKAHSPVTITVVTLANQRKSGNVAQVGQIRNGFGMVTAEVRCAEGNPMEWVADALRDELQQTGYQVTRQPVADATAGGTVVSGSVTKFFADMGVQVTMRAKIRLVVTRNGQIILNKEYVVDEGMATFTASAGDYEKIVTRTLTQLMRRAVPDVVAAIEGPALTVPAEAGPS